MRTSQLREPQQLRKCLRHLRAECIFDLLLRPKIHRKRDHLRPRDHLAIVFVDRLDLPDRHPRAKLRHLNPEQLRGVGEGCGQISGIWISAA